MHPDWTPNSQRLDSKQAEGNLLPGYSGTGTDAELRGLILQFTEQCQPDLSVRGCVFSPLKKLPD